MSEALSAYRRALADYEAEFTPPDSKVTHANYVGNVCRTLGILLVDMNQPAEAESAFRKALGYLKADLDTQPELFARLAWALSQRPDGLEEGRELSERAIRIQLAEVEKKPTDANARALAYQYYELRYRLEIVAGEHAAAVATIAESADVLKTGRSANQSYNAACGVALCLSLAQKDATLADDRRAKLSEQYGDNAMTLLQEAVSKGFTDFEHLKNDSDLDSLRARADFQKLAKELEENAAKAAIEPASP